MGPHGYRHNGFVVTPALGTQDVRNMDIYTYKMIKTNCHISWYMYINLMAWGLALQHSIFWSVWYA